jgi:endonuclease-3 related protein
VATFAALASGKCVGHDAGVMPADTIVQIHDMLFAAYGPQGWWPGETPTEVAIGAVLTQNTAWGNVERAIAAMKRVGCLDFALLDALGEDELGAVIRSAGTFRVKARRLKALATWVMSRGGSIESALRGETAEVRASLLAVAGIGPETADAILLYAGGHAVFVVDAYTRRVLRRHHVLDGDEAYVRVQEVIENALPRDADLFNEYHALVVEVGKRHCRMQARCAGCPLEGMPHDETL